MKIFIICCIWALLFCGCTQAEEIDERNFILSAGIDKGENNTIEIWAGAAKPDSYDSNTVKAEVIEKSCTSMGQVFEKNTLKDSRSMYFGHIKTIILSKEFLNDRTLVADFTDSIERENHINLKTNVLYTDESAEKCIEAAAEAEEGNGLYLWDYYKNNIDTNSTAVEMDFEKISKQLKTNGCAFIPKISVENNEITISGGCVLKDGKYAFEIMPDYIQGWLLAGEDCTGQTVESDIKGEKEVGEILENNCKITFFEDEQGLNCKFNLTADISIIQGQSRVGKYVAEGFENKIRSECIKTFEFLKEKNVDAFGICHMLKLRNKSLYEKYSGENAFEKMNFKTECKCKITGNGLKQ